MVEFTMVEMVLFGVCAVLLGLYVDAKRELDMTKTFLFHLIENPEARERMIEIHTDVTKQMRGKDATK